MPLIVSKTFITHLNNQKLNIITITNQIIDCFPMIKEGVGYLITTKNQYKQLNDPSLCFKEIVDIDSSNCYCILKKDIDEYKFKLIFNSI